jgi:enamine deaminase RidA (YjgF/YER057c/UK114 family)
VADGTPIAIREIDKKLAESGCSKNDIFHVTVQAKDIKSIGEFGAPYLAWLGDHRPTRVFVQPKESPEDALAVITVNFNSEAKVPVHFPGTDPSKLPYSAGMRTGDKHLSISGQIVPDEHLRDDYGAQVVGVISKVQTVVKTAGFDNGDVTKLGVFVLNNENIDKLEVLLKEHFPNAKLEFVICENLPFGVQFEVAGTASK